MLLTAIISVIFGLSFACGLDQVGVLLVTGISFIFIVSVFLTIGYTISGAELIIWIFGFKSATIDISTIKSVKCSYNPISSPAASLRRLEIKFYGRGKFEYLLISPVREAEFLAKLKEINPNIMISKIPKRKSLHFWDWDI